MRQHIKKLYNAEDSQVITDIRSLKSLCAKLKAREETSLSVNGLVRSVDFPGNRLY
jgi:hypothetical protein